MKKIYFNREKAVELQMTAETPEEANKRFDFSCSICNNAAWCNAEIVLRKNGLETEANAVGRLK